MRQPGRWDAFDELDDPLPPPGRHLELVRFCGARGCRRRTRPGGRHCVEHHAAAVRRWREGKRTVINTRRRDRAQDRTDDQRQRDSARAKLAMALKRGKIAKSGCQVCGTMAVTAFQADPKRPLDVVWLCRDDRSEYIGAQVEDLAAKASQDAWRVRRMASIAILELLPPAKQAELRAIASRGPAGLRLSPESPFYGQQLTLAVERNFGGRNG